MRDESKHAYKWKLDHGTVNCDCLLHDDPLGPRGGGVSFFRRGRGAPINLKCDLHAVSFPNVLEVATVPYKEPGCRYRFTVA
jgi:hypothetical protein